MNPLAAISGLSPAEKPSKTRETPVPLPDSDKAPKSRKKDDSDITKIREKHAQEKTAQRYEFNLDYHHSLIPD